MNYSRRDFGVLLPVLAAANAAAQPADAGMLPSKVYHSAQIPYQGDEKKKAREFFHGATHGGFQVQMHETILGEGVETHPPHRHAHEEIIVVVEGTVEALIEGAAEAAEAGSIVYFASNRMHSLRNGGKTPCRYYVVELRGIGA